MSGLTLYMYPTSTPSRVALLAARAVGVSFGIKHISVFKKEQLSEEFLKMNPQHCIPTLVDDGYVLWESKAIATYLAGKYGKDDQLYPKDIKKRSLVDQRLYFDSSSLFPKIRAIYAPVIFDGAKDVPEASKAELRTTLGFLDYFLNDSKWLAGDNYTLADTSIAASITTLQHIDSTFFAGFKNIDRWFEQCSKTLPGFQENVDGAKMMGEKYKNKLTEANDQVIL